MKISIEHIEKAILEASPKEQQRLLNDLPRLLRIPTAQMGLLKIAESSFEFWNNPDDSCYDAI
jgi:hypothetical protein